MVLGSGYHQFSRQLEQMPPRVQNPEHCVLTPENLPLNTAFYLPTNQANVRHSATAFW